MSEYTEFIEGIPVHPYAASFDMMSDDELQALADDIKAHGQREPIVVTYLDEAMLHEPVVIDGRNRYAACKLAGVEPKFRYAMSLDDREISPQVIADWIKSKNVHRRHMTREQRRKYIKDEISANPELPDYRIAKRVGASPHTVKRVREANPDLQVANGKRVNARGQVRPATYKPDPASQHPAMPKPEYTPEQLASKRQREANERAARYIENFAIAYATVYKVLQDENLNDILQLVTPDIRNWFTVAEKEMTWPTPR